jgi:phage terminase small subunit
MEAIPEIQPETSANLAPLSSLETPPIPEVSKTEKKDVQILHDNIQKEVDISGQQRTNEDKLPILNRKQRAFCDNILKGLTQTESYLKAGYKARNEHTASVLASKLLENLDIKQCIEIREKQIAFQAEKEANVSRVWALKMYKDVAERCAQEVKPVLDRKGNPVKITDKEGNIANAYVFDSAGVVKAVDGIARLQGYNAIIKVENTSKHALDTDGLSEKELSDLSKELQDKVNKRRGVSPVGKVDKGSTLKLIQKTGTA